MDAEIAVVGGGAAGLFAAYWAARSGRRVVLLEKNQRPGLKILISGGGRCNLTTTRSGKDLEAQYGTRRGRWLRHALRAFPPAELCTVFERAGVALREEDLEKIFPVSQNARDVLEALLRLAAGAGVTLLRGSPMLDLKRVGDHFAIDTPAAEILAPRVILATGGRSYPKTGTTGDGYRVCAALGHRIVATVPALAPLRVEADWVQALAGITLSGPGLSLLDGNGQVVRRRRRPLLFTHKGLSGPGPMDLAGDVEEGRGSCRLRIDFVPDASQEDLIAGLRLAAAQQGRRQVVHCLAPSVPERIRRWLVDGAGAAVPAAELSRQARHALVQGLKATELSIPSSLGFAHAEVTRGGVALEEIDARTMASRIVPGLFVCGELLDVDGPIGGFNFQAAFATARLAGLAAAAAADRTQ